MKTIDIFMDVSNLYYCINYKYGGKKLDYGKYLAFISDLGTVNRAVAYGSQLHKEAYKFIQSLKHIGFEPRFKTPKLMGKGVNTKRKSDWDVGIAIDMISSDAEMLILGSADSDMAPAVQYARDHGKKVVIFACGISSELHDAADDCIEITQSMLEDKGTTVSDQAISYQTISEPVDDPGIKPSRHPGTIGSVVDLTASIPQ